MVNAYLFMARFDDGLTAEIQVNPEFGSASAAMAEARTQKLIYCESGRIGPYFLDFSANRTTMHLQIEKIWPRFPTFSLRSFLPRRLLANMGDSSANCQPFFDPMSRRSGSIKGISLSGVKTTIFSFMQIMRKSPSPRVFWRRNWSTRGRTLPWTHPPATCFVSRIVNAAQLLLLLLRLACRPDRPMASSSRLHFRLHS